MDVATFRIPRTNLAAAAGVLCRLIGLALGAHADSAPEAVTAGLFESAKRHVEARLADDVFLAWRRARWLPLIYAHLISLRQWEALGRRSILRQAQGDRDSAALAA
jgi:hypothetical protein